jgi:hypothetical protein
VDLELSLREVSALVPSIAVHLPLSVQPVYLGLLLLMETAWTKQEIACLLDQMVSAQPVTTAIALSDILVFLIQR